MRHYYFLEHKPDPSDLSVRACPVCGGSLMWRYQQGVTWDRGLPYCVYHGLLASWIILSRDGNYLLGFGRCDNKGRILAEPRDLRERPIPARSERNARHHFKKRPSPQKSLLAIDVNSTKVIGPQTWPTL